MRSTPFLLVFLFTAVACGAPAAGVRDISADDLLAGPPEGAVILDVRTPQEFAAGHVPGAVNIPHDQLASRLGEIGAAKDAPVVVYCESGGRASVAASVLQGAGYRDIRHLAGDMRAWRADGLPQEMP